MSTCFVTPPELDPATHHFYCDVMHRLDETRVPFLVGGTYAAERYTGIPRRTKDLDLFILPSSLARVLEVAKRAGYRTEVTAPHWLGKIHQGEDFIDIIYGSGNKACPVDDEWFAHAVPEVVLGVPVQLSPAEEMIWSKAFIMERERFDGADVIHLIHSRAHVLDWQRLLTRFGPFWEVLLSHLVLFQFVYPHEKELIPREVMNTLLRRLMNQEPNREVAAAERLCQGTLLSKAQYRIDVSCEDYQDARLLPPVSMTVEELEAWNGVG